MREGSCAHVIQIHHCVTLDPFEFSLELKSFQPDPPDPLYPQEQQPPTLVSPEDRGRRTEAVGVDKGPLGSGFFLAAVLAVLCLACYLLGSIIFIQKYGTGQKYSKKVP